MENSATLHMVDISKSYPGVQALDNVRLDVMAGEVHALLGENGAGKSTLMKILMGITVGDKGEIYLDQVLIKNENTRVAIDRGISMIHQELNPIRDMTVAENIFLGREYTYGAGIFVDTKKMTAEAAGILKNFGLDIDAKAKMHTLSIAQIQMIEIIKAVNFGAKVIIMDEPTSSLTEEEIVVLFRKIRELKANNVAVIYITHRMEEVFEITDRITILRDGKYIATVQTSETNKAELVKLMVGREITNVYPKTYGDVSDIALEVKGLFKKGVFRDVNFTARKGEIVGFYGLVGAGRSEIFRAVFGLDSYDSGTVRIYGNDVHIRSVQDAIDHGLAFVTEDRKESGLVMCRSVRENIALPNLDAFVRRGFINKKKEKDACAKAAADTNVRMSSMNQLVLNLSGGNQQKVVVSKWLLRSPDILILDEPTRGIDVGAKAEIYKLIGDFTAAGMSIILISSELPEILGMSDRILVVSQGTVCGEFQYGAFDQDEILTCALSGGIAS